MARQEVTVEDLIRYPELIPPQWAEEQLTQLDPLRWGMAHLRTEKNGPLDYVDRPYLVDYIRDFHPHIVTKKGAQIAVTTSSFVKLLWFSDTHKVTSIYTFPTARDVLEFSSMRFKPMVTASSYILSRMEGVDNAATKQIGDSAIYFRGTKTETQALSVPADLLCHDELDFSNPLVKETYAPRLSVSPYKYTWEFSTPTIPKYGIDAMWRLSDKHYWLIKCICGKWQTVDYYENLYKRKGRYYFGCNRCAKELERRDGRWVAGYPNLTKDGQGIRGYFMPQTICPVIDASFLVEAEKSAKRHPKGIRIFKNFNLGQAHESGESVLTEKLIKSRVGDVRNQVGRVFMGVDQGDWLHIEIRAVYGDRMAIIHLETTDRFERINELIEQYHPTITVLDALPNKHSAKQIRDAHKGQVYLAYYSNTEGLWNPRNPDKEPYSILINHLDVMDNTAAEWKLGNVFLSSGISEELIEIFANMMTNLKRDEIEDKNGQNVPRWLKVGPDHYRHADAYAYIAKQLKHIGNAEDVVSAGVISSPYMGNLGMFTEQDVW